MHGPSDNAGPPPPPASPRTEAALHLVLRREKDGAELLQGLSAVLSECVDEVEIAPEAGVPRTLAEAAADKAKELGLSSRRKPLNSFEEHDEVWAVFDRDEHSHFEDAIALCNSRGVRVARSNPCFELWLILHGQDYDRPDDRATVQAHLRKLRPEYDPSAGKTPHCADLVTQVEIAERRAEAQLARREAEGAAFGRPSTTVGWLTQAIRFAPEKSTPR